MKIIHFLAENYKRLKVVEITPTGAVVDITGKNGQGKTSILDSIYAALAGKGAIPSKPVRVGEKDSRIELTLGTDSKVALVVKRRFLARKDGSSYTTSIVVEDAGGAALRAPQEVLDNLLGELSFDPLAFTRMDQKAQVLQLRRLVPGVDFEAMDDANQQDYEERTRVNRQAKSLSAQVAAIEVPGQSGQRVDETALVAELEAVGEQKAAIERERGRRDRLRDDVMKLEAEIETREQRIAEMRATIAEYEEALDGLKPRLGGAKDEILGLVNLADPPDTATIKARIDLARRQNAAVDEAERRLKTRNELSAELNRCEDRSEELSGAIAEREERKAAAVAAANLPVAGLALGEDAVLFNGLPLDQASDSEQLRVSIAIAAAMNPRLRVVRVRDGSLLDTGGMALLQEFAEKNDMQIWIERVSDGDGPNGIVIEDGRVKGFENAGA